VRLGSSEARGAKGCARILLKTIIHAIHTEFPSRACPLKIGG
jgi:hypothetical protein